MKLLTTALLLLLGLASSPAARAQDLFEEAGHAMAHSKWVIVRYLPLIQIALEADDAVLVESINHPARSFAMKIDGEAVAADCAVTEQKDQDFTIATESDSYGLNNSKTATATTSTTTTYWAKCPFEEGMAERARGAHEVIVQLAMTNGTTKPHRLGSKALRKFQQLR